MANVDKNRKCFKCGCSPAKDGVKLFRFPKPGIRNIIRCQLWAKYVFHEKDYCSTILQTKLHTEHRMLCQKHFNEADFIDESKTRLLRHAVPCDVELLEPQAGPSHRIAFADITNTINPSAPLNLEPASQNMAPETSSVAVQTVKMHEEKLLYAKCSRYFKQIMQMRNRLRNMRSNKILDTINDASCVRKLSKRITPTFALLLQSQLRNFKKKISRRRWTKEEKIVALRIFKKSPTCYRLLRRMFFLPAPTTLKTLLNKVPFKVGINKPVFEVIKKYNKTQKPSNNEYVIMFDEMSIKKHLSYNVKEDLIEGYQDHALQGRSANIASYALVFMIAGIRQKVKQPIAHYFSSGYSSADRLTVLIKEVLGECFKAGINIAAIVCDMDGVNRRALTILGASVDQPYITVQNKEIVALFDTPHLLKCFRNLFLKYDIECASNISSADEMGRGIAKWSHIKEFFALDNNNPSGFVFAPSLKNDHINPNPKQKMKVKLAAQVFSHSVAAGFYAKISGGELPAGAITTANLLANMDKLFDAVNSDSADLRRGKPHATNFTRTSPHMKIFKDMKLFFGTLKYIGSSRRPPSQDGWIWTINGIERVYNNLTKKTQIC